MIEHNSAVQLWLSKLNETWAEKKARRADRVYGIDFVCSLRQCVLAFGFLLGSCSIAPKTWSSSSCESYQAAQEQVEFPLPWQCSCVQVLTYLVRVVMEMLLAYLLILSQSVADCSVPTLWVSLQKSSFWRMVVLLTSYRVLDKATVIFCRPFMDMLTF